MSTTTPATSTTVPATVDPTPVAPPEPRHLGADERADVTATLLAAFSADPLVRWLFPAASRYLSAFPQLLDSLGSAAFDAGTADRSSDGHGAALWVPPGAPSDDDANAELLVRTIDVERHEEAFAFLEQVSAHHPVTRHWYLPFVGVDPHAQGRGHGSTLLARGLARADADGVPAYLEASSPRNRALYGRHGFEVVGEIQAGDSPPLWPMVRRPR